MHQILKLTIINYLIFFKIMKNLVLIHKVGETEKEVARWSHVEDEKVPTICINYLEGLVLGSEKLWYKDATWSFYEIWSYRHTEAYYFDIRDINK